MIALAHLCNPTIRVWKWHQRRSTLTNPFLNSKFTSHSPRLRSKNFKWRNPRGRSSSLSAFSPMVKWRSKGVVGRRRLDHQTLKPTPHHESMNGNTPPGWFYTFLPRILLTSCLHSNLNNNTGKRSSVLVFLPPVIFFTFRGRKAEKRTDCENKRRRSGNPRLHERARVRTKHTHGVPLSPHIRRNPEICAKDLAWRFAELCFVAKSDKILGHRAFIGAGGKAMATEKVGQQDTEGKKRNAKVWWACVGGVRHGESVLWTIEYTMLKRSRGAIPMKYFTLENMPFNIFLEHFKSYPRSVLVPNVEWSTFYICRLFQNGNDAATKRMTYYDMTHYDMTWYDMIWYGVLTILSISCEETVQSRGLSVMTPVNATPITVKLSSRIHHLCNVIQKSGNTRST